MIPLEAQKYSVRGLEQLFYVMSSLLESGLNDKLKNVGLLYTLVRDRTKLFKETHDALEAAYGSEIKIFDNYIPCGVAASQTPNYGKSVYSYMGNHRAGRLPSISEGLTLQTKERRALPMMITYSDLVQTGIFICVLVGLCYTIFKGKRK